MCFTYGTWFGVTALACRGASASTDAAVHKACAFLLQRQRLDGGWGESYLSCQDKVRPHLAFVERVMCDVCVCERESYLSCQDKARPHLAFLKRVMCDACVLE